MGPNVIRIVAWENGVGLVPRVIVRERTTPPA